METVCCLQVDEWLEYDEQPNQNTQTVPAFCFPDIAFGGRCPFPEWEYLHLDDASGKLNCQIQPIPTLDDNMTFQGLFTDRHPEGTIHLSYNLLPRILPEGYRRSPCFDFRAEPSGLTGTGLFSLILPFSEDKTEKMDVSLFWDLSKMPEGSRAILSSLAWLRHLYRLMAVIPIISLKMLRTSGMLWVVIPPMSPTLKSVSN